MSQRLAAFEKYYSWVPLWGFDYFRSRVTQARVESNQALEITTTYCDTRALQEEAVRALSFKCDVLWAMLDAMSIAYERNATELPVRAGLPAASGTALGVSR